MVLRDLYCSSCGHVAADYWLSSLCEKFVMMTCASCGKFTEYRAMCNGGTGVRYRANDFPSDPEFYRGQVKALGLTARDSDNKDVLRYNSSTKDFGNPMHDSPRYKNGTDARETKRDMLKHATRRSRGRLPLVCDMGKK